MLEQLKLPFYLWTREAVRRLILREHGVKLALSSVGNYLKAWGMTPQKPVRRAYERDDAQIARWLEKDYPRIAREAKRQRAVIYWGTKADFAVTTCAGAATACGDEPRRFAQQAIASAAI